MSRCFAFPPPGYEKKIKTDETDHLTKEKRKEKKHKKDKDREKKEGKEKKDKERSKEKHKERKEKKEKHKDRKVKDRDKEKSRTPEEKKPEALSDTRGREKAETVIFQDDSNGDLKFVQDLVRRINDGEEATGSRSEQRTKVASHRNAGLKTGRVVENNSCHLFQETNHRRDDDKRINTQRNIAVPKNTGNVFSREPFVTTDQKRVKEMGQTKDAGKQMVGKEKTQHIDSLINSDKPRDKEGVKKSDPKFKERPKEKKEEKSEVINKAGLDKPKVIEGVSRLKERDRDSLDNNSKPPDLSKASNKNINGEGNLGKRKDLETNGFLYEIGSGPNKLQRPVTSIPAVENGRKVGANQTPPKPTSEPQGLVRKPDVREHRINGFIDSQEPKVHVPSSLVTTAKLQVKENGGASAKAPHPDLKYLTQILTLPERGLPEFDEQEWLLGNLGVKSKKPRTDDSPMLDETQVWDQAYRIESADIAALPYVVPY